MAVCHNPFTLYLLLVQDINNRYNSLLQAGDMRQASII